MEIILGLRLASELGEGSSLLEVWLLPIRHFFFSKIIFEQFALTGQFYEIITYNCETIFTFFRYSRV